MSPSDHLGLCPYCRVQLRAATLDCPRCGAQFKITDKGYCPRDHTLVDVTTEGRCPICDGEVVDRHSGRALLKPPATTRPPYAASDAQRPSPLSPLPGPAVQQTTGHGTGLAVLGVVVCLAAVLGGWIMGNRTLTATATGYVYNHEGTSAPGERPSFWHVSKTPYTATLSCGSVFKPSQPDPQDSNGACEAALGNQKTLGLGVGVGGGVLGLVLFISGMVVVKSPH